MAGKLDLAGLTDEEAKHVWNVIQRDFNLRKAEEDRLGTLKEVIEKEDTKIELLGSQTCNLADSHCIRCLQPFKFIMNSKRQCLDCQMYTCKSCSRYNKKEHGWVCDNCRMTRVLKVGTVGWYHDNVRTRFKRFGSAKVMRSLYKRLNGDGGRDEDTQSMPDVRSVYTVHKDDHDEAEAQRYRMTRRNKRLLSVHPMDFDAAEDYFSHSRRQSIQSHNQIQEERGYRNDVDYHHTDVLPQRGSRRKSLAGYSVRTDERRPDDHGDNRMVRTRSLSKISSTMARQQYVDTSDEEDYQRYPPTFQQAAYRVRRPSRASSQENLGQAMPITELNKRMSAIESLLNRLDGKMTSPDEAPAADAKAEEAKLRRKLSELAGHLSEGKGGASSDEDGSAPGGRRPPYSLPRGIPAARTTNTPNEPDLSSSSDELPTDAQKRSTATALCDLTTEVLRTINATENALVEEYGHSGPDYGHSSVRTHLLSVEDVKQAEETYRELEENVYITAGKSFELESKLRLLEHNTKNHQDSDLSDLEDVLALTAARVQSTESEVSDIENKIAALSAMDKSKKKMSGPQQRKRFTPDARNSNSSGFQWKSTFNNIF